MVEKGEEEKSRGVLHFSGRIRVEEGPFRMGGETFGSRNAAREKVGENTEEGCREEEESTY